MVLNWKPEELREFDIHCNAKQRLSTIKNRIDNPQGRHNMLCIYVMAVESLARTLYLEDLKVECQATKNKAFKIYEKKVKYKKPQELLKNLCKNAGVSVNRAFGKNWKNYVEAIEWRNLLMHEGTCINGKRANKFINSCLYIFDKLIYMVNVRYKGNLKVRRGENSLIEKKRITDSYTVLK